MIRELNQAYEISEQETTTEACMPLRRAGNLNMSTPQGDFSRSSPELDYNIPPPTLELTTSPSGLEDLDDSQEQRARPKHVKGKYIMLLELAVH